MAAVPVPAGWWQAVTTGPAAPTVEVWVGAVTVAAWWAAVAATVGGADGVDGVVAVAVVVVVAGADATLMSTWCRAPATTFCAGAGSAEAAASAVVVPNSMATEAATTATRAGRRSRLDGWAGHEAETESNRARASASDRNSEGVPGPAAAASSSARGPSVWPAHSSPRRWAHG